MSSWPQLSGPQPLLYIPGRDGERVNEHRLSTMLWALMRAQQRPGQWTTPQRRALQEAPSKMGHFQPRRPLPVPEAVQKGKAAGAQWHSVSWPVTSGTSTFALKSHYENAIQSRLASQQSDSDHSPGRTLPGRQRGPEVREAQLCCLGKSLKYMEASPNQTHFWRFEALH